jgi:hypothetical protein
MEIASNDLQGGVPGPGEHSRRQAKASDGSRERDLDGATGRCPFVNATGVNTCLRPGSDAVERAFMARVRGWRAGKWPAPPVP